MRHQLRVPLLSKPADQRKALLRALTTQLIREGRITTTKARAKALRNEAERMISLARRVLYLLEEELLVTFMIKS